ncbi:MAG: CHAT domain-containing protein, partial [Burkholderiaceae bacterium]
RDWQVVHIAGHGAPPEIGGAARGVVLSHGFLGPAEIQAMRTVPELVFVNCCFLAERPAAQLLAGPGNLAQFASTVADALINLGVRCVIAAGWAVDDGPAEVFATAFYGALLRGQRFIDAAALARERAWDAAPDSNTWAAYQCYGDPNWTLRRESAQATPVPPSERFAGVSSPLALTLALETVAVEARTVRGADDAERSARRAVHRQRLTYLEGRFAELWGGMGAVAEAYALAWSELGETAPAIDWYRRAVDANDGSASQQAAEQWANLRVRAAEGRVTAALAQAREGGAAAARQAAALTRLRSAARSEIRAALRSIEQLLALSPTMARHSLAGSANKRLAMIESDAGRERAALSAISAMKRHFAAAEARARETGSPDLHHPGLNRLAAELASDAARSGWNGFDGSEVEAVRRSLDERSRTDPDFWSVAGLTELRLYEAVAQRRLAPAATSIAADWRALHARISAPRNWRSVHDTIRFVLERYLRRAPADDLRACRDILALLKSIAWPPGASSLPVFPSKRRGSGSAGPPALPP